MELVHLSMFAWCVPLVAIPILLHLLTLHRLRTVDLSTFRFLFDTYVQQRRKMKFMDALIALLRTLFLLFLILACARPMIRHWNTLFGGAGGGREIFLLVDCSASMNAVTDGVSAFDRAKLAASAVVDKLGSDDLVTLVRVASRPEEIVSKVTADTDSLKEKLGALKTSPSRANLFATFTQLFSGGAPMTLKPQIYFFTDSQASGWRELREQPAEDLVPEGSKLFVIDVGSSAGEIPNRAVVGEVPEAHRAIAGLPLPLKTRVVNYSKDQSEDVTVSLLIDDKEIARKSLTLKPGETANAPFLFVPTEPGTLKGRFEISADRFPNDDTFLFTLSVEPQVRVVIVNGNPTKNPKDPFENEALYLNTAFTATEPDDVGQASKLPGQNPTDAKKPGQVGNLPHDSKLTEADRRFVKSLDVVELNENQVNADAIKEASVVILANCGTLNDQQCGFLRDHVSRGGGLMILPGDKCNHDQYNKKLFAIPGTTDQFITTAQLQPADGDVEKSETFERFASIDFAHPVLSVFENREARYLTKVSVYRRFPLKLPAERGNTWPLLEFGNGTAALVESRYGDGRVILAAFPMSSKWTNLPLKPEFVPLVLRLVSHIRTRAGVEGPSVVAANGVAEISVAKAWQNLQSEVVNVEGNRLPVTFEKSVNRQVGAFSATAEKGFYDVDVRGGRIEQPKHESLAFAVNLAREESNFALINETQLKELLPSVDLKVIDASAETQQLHGSIGQEHEIWRPLIYLLFVVIVVEFWLSTFGGQRLDSEEGQTVTERLKDLGTGGFVGRMTGAGQGS
ncbi:membrane protein [Planctomycetia bacterium]|nr:membrane protein [Planctomycetia bacterium]